jgi:phosphoglycerate dehydrogenase-like enzyme
MKIKSAYFGIKDRNHIDRVFSKSVKDEIQNLTEVFNKVIDKPELSTYADNLRQIEVAFATWGVPAFTESEIKTYLPNLKALFYAAGTVQDFARPFLNCGVRVFSGWGANGVPVAEYAVSQIILANKGFFQCIAKTNCDYWAARRYAETFRGNYFTNVGILGAGMIGKLVINLLKACDLNIMVFDPFLSGEEAARLGVTLSSLEEIFSGCQTISNHLANNADTVGMLSKQHFSLMKPNATFINTGRGAQVVENDLIEALKAEPARSAVLDVTYPEPPARGSELYVLDNVFLTPHIAGSISGEMERMAVFMLDEFKRYINGEEELYEVKLNMLKTMA